MESQGNYIIVMYYLFFLKTFHPPSFQSIQLRCRTPNQLLSHYPTNRGGKRKTMARETGSHRQSLQPFDRTNEGQFIKAQRLQTTPCPHNLLLPHYEQ